MDMLYFYCKNLRLCVSDYKFKIILPPKLRKPFALLKRLIVLRVRSKIFFSKHSCRVKGVMVLLLLSTNRDEDDKVKEANSTECQTL